MNEVKYCVLWMPTKYERTDWAEVPANQSKKCNIIVLPDHTYTPGRTPLDEGSARRRGLYMYNTQRTQGTNIHALGGIRNRSSSNLATSGISLHVFESIWCIFSFWSQPYCVQNIVKHNLVRLEYLLLFLSVIVTVFDIVCSVTYGTCAMLWGLIILR